MKIGILALQGTFMEHIASLNRLGVEPVSIRQPEDLRGVSGIIIPGGESTTITHLMHYYRLSEPLKEMAESGVPFLGTCAGMICMAREAGGSSPPVTLEIMDIKVRRNAFGRQLSSFEERLEVPVLGKGPFPGLFIRAPVIESTGEGASIIARLPGGAAVAAMQGSLLATAFHPELMEDLRLHRFFLDLCSGYIKRFGGIV